MMKQQNQRKFGAPQRQRRARAACAALAFAFAVPASLATSHGTAVAATEVTGNQATPAIPKQVATSQPQFAVGALRCDSNGKSALDLRVNNSRSSRNANYLFVIGEPQVHARTLTAPAGQLSTHELAGIPDGRQTVSVWDANSSRRIAELGTFVFRCEAERKPARRSAWIGPDTCDSRNRGVVDYVISNESKRRARFEVIVGKAKVHSASVTLEPGETKTYQLAGIPSGVYPLRVQRNGKHFASLGIRSFTCDMSHMADMIQPVVWVSADYQKQGIRFSKHNAYWDMVQKYFREVTGGMSRKTLKPIVVYSNYTNYQAQCGNLDDPKATPRRADVKTCLSIRTVIARDVERAGIRMGNSHSDGPGLSVLAFGGGGHAGGSPRYSVVGEYGALPFFASCSKAIPAWPGDEPALRSICNDNRTTEASVGTVLHEEGHAFWELPHIDGAHPSPSMRNLGNWYLMMNHGAFPATGFHDWELSKISRQYTTGSYSREAPQPTFTKACNYNSEWARFDARTSTTYSGQRLRLINPYAPDRAVVGTGTATTVWVRRSDLGHGGAYFIQSVGQGMRQSRFNDVPVDVHNLPSC